MYTVTEKEKKRMFVRLFLMWTWSTSAFIVFILIIVHSTIRWLNKQIQTRSSNQKKSKNLQSIYLIRSVHGYFFVITHHATLSSGITIRRTRFICLFRVIIFFHSFFQWFIIIVIIRFIFRIRTDLYFSFF